MIDSKLQFVNYVPTQLKLVKTLAVKYDVTQLPLKTCAGRHSTTQK